MTEEEEHNWHLDRRVPVAMILAIAGQTVAIAWWAATAESRLGIVERDIAALSNRVAVMDAQIGDNRNTASRIDERLKTVLRMLEGIERKLDGRMSP